MGGTIEQATEAARDARDEQRDSAVVLLSPACASFDQFPNFEVRGDAFARPKDLPQETGAMLISRADRGLLANWWFTVDRILLMTVLLLMALGVLFSMAASPPAQRLGLPDFHFFNRQLAYLQAEPRGAVRHLFSTSGPPAGSRSSSMFSASA